MGRNNRNLIASVMLLYVLSVSLASVSDNPFRVAAAITVSAMLLCIAAGWSTEYIISEHKDAMAAADGIISDLRRRKGESDAEVDRLTQLNRELASDRIRTGFGEKFTMARVSVAVNVEGIKTPAARESLLNEIVAQVRKAAKWGRV